MESTNHIAYVLSEKDDDYFEKYYGDRNWFKKNALDFDDAQESCEDHGGHLAIIRTEAEQRWLQFANGYSWDCLHRGSPRK